MPKGVYPRNELHREICRKANLGRTPWNKGYKHPEETKPIPPKFSGKDHPMFGKKHKEESKLKMSESINKIKHLKRKRVFPDNYSEIMRDLLGKGEYLNCLKCDKVFYATRRAIKRGLRYCSKICGHDAMVGDKNPNWNNGSSFLSPYKHYNNAAYKNWRKAVFIRDNNTCQKCGEKNNKIHPHHIKSYTYFPEERYNLDNGITLCVECHMNVHRNAKKGERILLP